MTTQAQEKKESIFRPVTIQELDFTLPEKSVSEKQFARAVRVLSINWRQGTVGSKGRSDVSLSGKKPWKQKGTGRARAGTARSPLWRGGGITFGPQPRNRMLAIPQQMKKQVLAQLIADRLKNNKIIVADWQITGDKPQTKQAAQLLHSIGFADKKVVLFLPSNDLKTFASFINIPTVNVLLFDQVNAYDLANAEILLILQKDFDALHQMVGGLK